MGDTNYYDFFKKKFQWETPKGSAQYGRKAGWRPGEGASAAPTKPLAKLVGAEKKVKKLGKLRKLFKGIKSFAGKSMGIGVPALVGKMTDITLKEKAKRRYQAYGGPKA